MLKYSHSIARLLIYGFPLSRPLIDIDTVPACCQLAVGKRALSQNTIAVKNQTIFAQDDASQLNSLHLTRQDAPLGREMQQRGSKSSAQSFERRRRSHADIKSLRTTGVISFGAIARALTERHIHMRESARN